MTERMLGPKGRRKRRLLLLLPFVAIAALVLAIGASATGPVGTAAGFEDDDGNLVVNSTFDWNGFSPLTWTGSAPYQSASKTASGWQFNGLTDDQKSGTDSGFGGGTKQDDDCPSVTGSSAPNKDDLKRIYIAQKTVNGQIYLMLAWVRIPLNTTSSSAHIGFEFNQATTPCPAPPPTNSDGLVKRTAGDMLIVYDFEGGSSSPVLTVRRWVLSGACDVSSDSAPCWGVAQNLTASGFAEAKVNTTATVCDALPPGANCSATPSTETLGLNEFGEAGINLTAAGIFTQNQCTAFGQAEGVSRSSGNSGSAAMEDLVGPGHVTISNCGEIKVIKRTNPRDLNQNFSFTSNIENSSTKTCTADTSPNVFTLNDTGAGDNSTNTEDCLDVQAGNYFIKESSTDPSGFAFKNVQCTATNGATATADVNDARKINIGLVGSGVVTCIYTNDRVTGAIAVTKTGKDKRCTGTPLPSTCQSPSVALLSGATFQIWKETNGTAGLQIPGDTLVTSGSTGTDGTKCFGNLLFGGYYARETVAPNGYKIDNAVSALKTVNASGACPSTGTVVPVSFTDSPLSKITISFESKAGAGATLATISCSNPSVPSENLVQGTPKVLDNLVPDTATGYTCTVKIDP